MNKKDNEPTLVDSEEKLVWLFREKLSQYNSKNKNNQISNQSEKTTENKEYVANAMKYIFDEMAWPANEMG